MKGLQVFIWCFMHKYRCWRKDLLLSTGRLICPSQPLLPRHTLHGGWTVADTGFSPGSSGLLLSQLHSAPVPPVLQGQADPRPLLDAACCARHGRADAGALTPPSCAHTAKPRGLCGLLASTSRAQQAGPAPSSLCPPLPARSAAWSAPGWACRGCATLWMPEPSGWTRQ